MCQYVVQMEKSLDFSQINAFPSPREAAFGQNGGGSESEIGQSVSPAISGPELLGLRDLTMKG